MLAHCIAGHLALSQGALPLVVPVSSALRGDRLYVRARLGHVAPANFRAGIVAFQTAVTSLDQAWRTEVLVRGPADVLEHEPGPELAPPPLAVVGRQATTVLSISLELVTGWQYGTATPAVEE